MHCLTRLINSLKQVYGYQNYFIRWFLRSLELYIVFKRGSCYQWNKNINITGFRVGFGFLSLPRLTFYKNVVDERIFRYRPVVSFV